MMKNKKGIISLIVIIVVLVGAVFALKYIKTGDEEQTPDIPEVETIDILKLDSESLSSVKITGPEDEYTLEFTEKISIKEIPDAYINESRAKAAKSVFSDITTTEIISEAPEDYSVYGLSEPKFKVEIKDTDNKVNTLYVGDMLPTGDGAYSRLNDEDKVFVLSFYTLGYVTNDSSYYRTMNLYEIDRNTIHAVSIDANGKYVISFEENIVEDTNTPHNVFNKYQMTSPYNWPASGDMVGKIFDSLQQLDVIEFVSEDSSDKALYGFSPYNYKLSATYGDNKKATISFGDVKDGIVYVKTDIDNKIYGISYEPFTYLELDPFSYLSNFAFLRNIMTVKTINYTHGDISAKFELKPVDQENVDVKKDGKNISQDEFKTLYQELISISVDGAYNGERTGEPLLSYVFDYTNGETEKVEFYKIDERRSALFVNGECQFYVNAVDLGAKLEIIDEIIKAN